LKEDERERRNTADCVIGGFRAKRQPRPPDPVLPLKLKPVRRAHMDISNTVERCVVLVFKVIAEIAEWVAA
jgi:hypothetical protein